MLLDEVSGTDCHCTASYQASQLCINIMISTAYVHAYESLKITKKAIQSNGKGWV